jgi:hypothetical protein
MRLRKLLLKSIKLTLPSTIGCIIGIVIFYIPLQGSIVITRKHFWAYIMVFAISFFILTGIVWLFKIVKQFKTMDE